MDNNIPRINLQRLQQIVDDGEKGPEGFLFIYLFKYCH